MVSRARNSEKNLLGPLQGFHCLQIFVNGSRGSKDIHPQDHADVVCQEIWECNCGQSSSYDFVQGLPRTSLSFYFKASISRSNNLQLGSIFSELFQTTTFSTIGFSNNIMFVDLYNSQQQHLSTYWRGLGREEVLPCENGSRGVNGH